MDKTPQIAEEQLVMTMDKAQEAKRLKIRKLAFRYFLMTSAKKKEEEISRWRPIDKALHYDFSATKMFFKKRHNVFIKNTHVLSSNGFQQETKRSILQDYEVTHRQIDCYNPPPTLGLIIIVYNN